MCSHGFIEQKSSIVLLGTKLLFEPMMTQFTKAYMCHLA